MLTSGSIEQSEKNKSRNRKKTFALFEQLYGKERPDIVSGFKRFGMSKNYVSPKIKFVDNKGKKRSISLLHPESFIGDMVLARRLMTDAEHQANTYKVLRSNAKRVAFSLPGELQREAVNILISCPAQMPYWMKVWR